MGNPLLGVFPPPLSRFLPLESGVGLGPFPCLMKLGMGPLTGRQAAICNPGQHRTPQGLSDCLEHLQIWEGALGFTPSNQIIFQFDEAF